MDGEYKNRDRYIMTDVNWLSGTEEHDSEAKLADNLSTIAKADYLVLASNRNYGVIPRLAERYPLSSQYYQMLFDGDLGYEVVYTNLRSPNFAEFHLKPDNFSWPGLEPPQEVTKYLDEIPGILWGRFDESFTVYDQPTVIILKNIARFTAEEMNQLFHHS
jgi:hypothetical protein